MNAKQAMMGTKCYLAMLVPGASYAVIFGFAMKCRHAYSFKAERVPAVVPEPLV